MLGIFGAIIYGIAATIGWCQDERQEQYDRKSSKERNLPYYYDKRGRQRWTATGRKRTAQEIYKEYEDRVNENEKRRKKIQEQKFLNDYKRKYDLFVIHKDNLSFEEFVAVHLPSNLLEYETFRKIKKNVSEERIREIEKNPIKYG